MQPFRKSMIHVFLIMVAVSTIMVLLDSQWPPFWNIISRSVIIALVFMILLRVLGTVPEVENSIREYVKNRLNK